VFFYGTVIYFSTHKFGRSVKRRFYFSVSSDAILSCAATCRAVPVLSSRVLLPSLDFINPKMPGASYLSTRAFLYITIQTQQQQLFQVFTMGIIFN